jgi:hypothetical protein
MGAFKHAGEADARSQEQKLSLSVLSPALPHGKMLPGNIKLAGFVASNEMLPDRWVVSYSIFLLLYS